MLWTRRALSGYENLELGRGGCKPLVGVVSRPVQSCKYQGWEDEGCCKISGGEENVAGWETMETILVDQDKTRRT